MKDIIISLISYNKMDQQLHLPRWHFSVQYGKREGGQLKNHPVLFTNDEDELSFFSDYLKFVISKMVQPHHW